MIFAIQNICAKIFKTNYKDKASLGQKAFKAFETVTWKTNFMLCSLLEKQIYYDKNKCFKNNLPNYYLGWDSQSCVEVVFDLIRLNSCWRSRMKHRRQMGNSRETWEFTSGG